MDHPYQKALGGVSRFLEVWEDPDSSPRDRLLAKRTWQHRQLADLSAYLDVNNMGVWTDPLPQPLVASIDLGIEHLNFLRTVDPPPVDEIRSTYGEILATLAIISIPESAT